MKHASKRPKIGLSMRVTEAIEYAECRDSIAHDWLSFVKRLRPDADFFLLPNIGVSIREYATNLGLNAIILTGGNDLGEYPIRDITETNLIDWGHCSGIPTLGVCRGMQMIVKHFGGVVENFSDGSSEHVATSHEIEMAGSIRTVNSYHKFIVQEHHVPSNFEVLAKATKDNTVEAIKNDHILAVMWHPERHGQLNWETQLIKKHFNL